MAYNDLSRAMDRMLTPWEGFFAVPTRMMDSARDARQVQDVYRSEVESVDGGYKLTFDVPGFAPEDLDLNVYPDHVTLKASQSKESKDGKVTRSISRDMSFDSPVDASSAEADLTNGVLTMSVKTSVASQGRKVAIGPAK